jgi:hypothetical protein
VLVPPAIGDRGQSCGSSCSSSVGRHWAELRAKVYLRAGVGISNGSVFGCHETSGVLVERLPAWSLIF